MSPATRTVFVVSCSPSPVCCPCMRFIVYFPLNETAIHKQASGCVWKALKLIWHKLINIILVHRIDGMKSCLIFKSRACVADSMRMQRSEDVHSWVVCQGTILERLLPGVSTTTTLFTTWHHSYALSNRHPSISSYFYTSTSFLWLCWGGRGGGGTDGCRNVHHGEVPGGMDNGSKVHILLLVKPKVIIQLYSIKNVPLFNTTKM